MRSKNNRFNNLISRTDTSMVMRILFWLFLATGFFVRVFRFGSFPSGLNQDEAFAGYEAYSLLHYGTDTAGYHNPVYLVAWGSGMNALETYLMIPFVAIFGLTPFAIRLPQLLLSIASLIVTYLLTSRLFDKKTGLAALGLLAVCPWHILLSRWALESNLAPGFILIATYFFVLGADKNKYLILSAVFYGLSLYTYATIWTIVPFILLFEILYLVYTRKITLNIHALISGAVLAVMAVPLILFVLVNTGHMNEIRSSFISIPKLLYFRSGEVSFKDMLKKSLNLWDIFKNQSDGLPWNFVEGYGFIGYVIWLLSIGGFVLLVYALYKQIRKEHRTFAPGVILMINFLAALVLGTLINVNINRINILFIPVVIFAAYCLGRIKSKWVMLGVAAYFALFTISFEKAYYTTYNEKLSYHFGAGLDQALETANSKADKVYLSSAIHYPKVLFYDKIPVDEFRDSVVYNNYPAAFLSPDSFTHYSYVFDINSPSEDGAYIIRDGEDTGAFTEHGFTAEKHGVFLVMYR